MTEQTLIDGVSYESDGDVLIHEPYDAGDTGYFRPAQEYMSSVGAVAQDTQPHDIETQEEIPTTHAERLELERRERAGILFHNPKLAFAVKSKEEVSTATTLMGFAEKPGGVSRHLNEILIHQQKSISTEPRLAMISKVNEIFGYAQDSRGSIAAIEALSQSVDRSNPNNFQLLKNVDTLYEAGDVSNRAIKELAHFESTMKFIEGGPDALDDVPSKEQLDSTLSTQVHQIRQLSSEVIASNQNRYNYYVDVLSSLLNHNAINGVVRDRLERLGVKI